MRGSIYYSARPRRGLALLLACALLGSVGGIAGQAVRDGAGAALTPAQVYAQQAGAVVGIVNAPAGQTHGRASVGSGFVVSGDGYIITNYHVVAGAQALQVSLQDAAYPAVLVAYAADSDVAVLKIRATGLQRVRLGDSDALAVGDQVAAIGNPLGELTYTMTVGYISARNRAVTTEGAQIAMLQTDAAINAGSSGGPLFDMQGRVVGITTAKYSGINTLFTLFIVYILSGCGAAIGGILQSARQSAAQAGMGDTFQMTAIASIVIGGTSMAGEGSVFGAIIGALILTLIVNAMNLLGVPALAQSIVTGAIIVLAVLLDVQMKRIQKNRAEALA